MLWNFRQFLCLLFLFGYLGLSSQSDIDHWETVVSANDLWSYRLGTSAPPGNWLDPNFDDSDWEQGIGGIGYGDDDDGTVVDPVTSVILRIDFEIFDTSNISMAVLHADYDDSFIAFLNGVEIGRGNVGDPNLILGFDESPPIDQEAVLYAGGIPESYPLYPLFFDSVIQEGQNTLAIQVNNFGITSSDLSSNFFLSLGITDSSQDYEPTPDWFFEPFFSTNLPLVRINTFGQNIPDEPRIVANMKIINNGIGETNFLDDPPTDYDGQIAIEIRGASSQFFEKNNYGFETQDEFGENNNVSLLGMPEENDWILHGPYSDKSLIRNALTFEMGNDIMNYASRTRFCELMINDQYRGVYLLMEKIKEDENRVDIATLQPDDLEGDELTGGYIFQVDRDNMDTEEDGWYATFAPYAFYSFHDPGYDQLAPQQKEYIQNWVFEFEVAMFLSNYESTYQNYIDVESFIDYFIINEITKHIDAYKLSFYMYKQQDSNGGKLLFGPIWDFNLGYSNFDFGCDPSPQGWIHECNFFVFWVNKIIGIEAVQDQMYCRWQQLRQDELDTDFLLNRIDSLVQYIGPAADRNFQQFDILGTYVWPNLFIGETYEEEIDFLRGWLVQRLFWMDANMLGNPDADCSEILSETSRESESTIRAYPNPFEDRVTLSLPDLFIELGEVQVYDALGKMVFEINNYNGGSINLDQLQAGVYLLQFTSSDINQTVKLIKE